MEANEFTVYIVTATERNIVRALVEDTLGIPPARVIGTEYGYTATGQGDAADGDYTFQSTDEVVFDGNYYGENAKMSKVDAIVREIGQQPVLAFGNSSGDVAMCAYTVTRNPYAALSYIVLADDEVREWGDATITQKKTEEYAALGIGTISMRDDFATIYGDGVRKDRNAPMLPNDSFYITEITDEIFDRIYGKSFKEDCTLPREDLRYLHVLHKDSDGNEHEGEMIVNRHIAEDVLEILRQLYEADYPIEKIRLIDEYDADDEASMEDNNSSAFNFRFISHTTRVSKHGLGLAVDINTLYNPYTKIVDGERIIEPINGEPYLDRNAEFPYKIDENDLCYQLFTEHGFECGGAWEDRKDYQHFEIPDERIAEWYPENGSGQQ